MKSDKLDALRERKAVLCRALGEVNQGIRDEEQALVYTKYRVKVGSLVRDCNGVLHQVALVDVCHYGPPWLVGFRQRKDKTFGAKAWHIRTPWVLEQGVDNMPDNVI